MGFTVDDNINTTLFSGGVFQSSDAFSTQAAPYPVTSLFLLGNQDASSDIAILPLIASSGSGVNNPIPDTQIPMVQSSAGGYNSVPFGASVLLPAIQSSADGVAGKAEGYTELKIMTSSATGFSGSVGRSVTVLPSVASSGVFDNRNVSLDVSTIMPLVSAKGTGICGGTATADHVAFRLKSTGYGGSGAIGSASVSLPMMRSSSAMHVNNSASVSSSVLMLLSRGTGGLYDSGLVC